MLSKCFFKRFQKNLDRSIILSMNRGERGTERNESFRRYPLSPPPVHALLGRGEIHKINSTFA